jgi:hypothetical protein
MARLLARRLARFEEHLLLCRKCQKAVANADQYVAAMRLALRELGAGSHDERRQAPRVRCRREVMLTEAGAETTLTAKATDRSSNGFGLTLGVGMPRGTAVTLAVQGGRYQGQVAWCQPHGVGYRLGIELCG